MDVYGRGKNLCHKDNLIVLRNHIYIYCNCPVECTKCSIAGLKNRNGANVGGLREKLKYIIENAVVTNVLEVLKLNFRKRVCIWNAVHNYFVPKHEGKKL